MEANLGTTNVLLGIMAAVSLLEAVAVVGLLFGAFLAYRRVLKVIGGIEERQVAPAAARINAVLDDIKNVTSTAKDDVRRAETFVNRLVDSVQRFRSRP